GALESYARARNLAEQQGNPRQQFMAVYGIWQSTNGAGAMDHAQLLSDQLLRLAAGAADDELHLQAPHSGWTTCMFSGASAVACEHCEAGRRLYDLERHRSHRRLYGGHDPGICAGYMGAQVYWLLGYPAQGLSTGRDSLALAEQIGHAF